MIEITTTIIFDNDEKQTIRNVEMFPDELLLFPEYLDTHFKDIKFKIKDYIRNTPDREFIEKVK